MAQRGRPCGGHLDDGTRRAILRLARALSLRGAAREAGVSRNTVRKYVRRELALRA